ncbi:methyl-accepting chemotaxis protein, partial [Noviherbaspirillum massiliense]|uniref:methyl-accepting chemotaxis protein n=1 Tax=Noviherbaspirillum massiliense TaxID=1465823 RepID=UPI000372CFA8
MKLNDLKIGTRLYLGFGAMVALLLVLVVTAYVNFAKSSQATDLNIRSYEVLDVADGVLESLLNMETGERGFALTGKESMLEPYKAGKEAFKKHVDTLKSLTSDNPKQQERVEKLLQEQQQWVKVAIDPLISMRRDVEAGNELMDSVVAWERAGRGKKGMDAMRAILAEISDVEEALLKQRVKDAAVLKSRTSATLIGGGILAAVLGVILALWIARNITRPLADAVKLARQVAEGDLRARVEVKSKDETGELMSALKNMNESLIRIVSNVRAGTDAITSASQEIAAGNMDLS